MAKSLAIMTLPDRSNTHQPSFTSIMGVFSRITSLFVAAAGVVAVPASLPMPEGIPTFSPRSGNSSVSDLIRRAESVNFNQDYIASGASVTYTPNESTGTFSVSYNTNEDFVVGLGWQPGDTT